MRAAAADVAYLMGLYLANDPDDGRPLMYATSFACERLGWHTADGEWDKRRASYTIRRLEKAGVLRCVGAMKPLGKAYGTKLYAPPLPVAPAGVDAVELEPVGVEAVPVQPAHEAGDDLPMGGAVLATYCEPRASGDRADEGVIGHGADATAATGGYTPCPNPETCEYRDRQASGPSSCAANAAKHPPEPPR